MQRLPEYEALGMLREGPVADVYRARRRGTGEIVTVKLLRAEYPDARQIARLRHEYVVTRRLDLPGVVRALSFVPAAWSAALILEDCDAQPLHEILRAGPLAIEEALRIFISVAGALGAVHGRHVVHKDITPQHILVHRASGGVKLTEFGVAASLTEEFDRPTHPDRIEGTLAYLSPEQTGRMNRALDDRSDLYSLGVTMYEALTGALPFPAKDAAELIHCHIAKTPTPPHLRAPSVPEALSQIVMKLLAKNAEDRYQGALGLKADLELCLARLDSSGRIAPFPIATRDVTSVLRIPQKLYGRAAEAQKLDAAFKRCLAGEVGVIWLAGAPGVGKSALVTEVSRELARQGGYFIAGKFDLLGRSVPYSAVTHALQELFRQILGEPPPLVDSIRERLRAALGPNGRLITDLVPNLEKLIGPQPEAPALGPTETQNRFQIVLQDFMCALAGPERPLVLFLDDLQWADPASLKLLEMIAADREASHLLVLCAYRDNEVSDGLAATLTSLAKARARVDSITIEPLSQPHVEQFIADALGASRPSVAPLAALVFEKTRGNPFFLSQFIRMLDAEELIHLRADEGGFSWDLDAIRARSVTENVVEFMARRVRSLPAPTQRALSLAASIGHEFDLATLCLITESSQNQAGRDLHEALREGLVVPADPEYKLVADAAGDDAADFLPAMSFEVSYRFLHDRVQQAAYALNEETSRPALHLRIGRLLRARASEAGAHDPNLFTVVDHLNQGRALISDPAERVDLARRDLAAGERAKAGAAYEAAAGYFRIGAGLLGDSAWDDEYALAFALRRSWAECEYLCGRHSEAERLFADLLTRARSKLEKAGIYRLLTSLYHLATRHPEAIEAARKGLALLGVVVPKLGDDIDAEIRAEREVIDRALTSRSIEDLSAAPVVEDPELRAQYELLSQLDPPSASYAPTLFVWVIHKMTSLSVTHGVTEVSCHAYGHYGFVLCYDSSRLDDARRFFDVAIALEKRIGTREQRTAFVLKTEVGRHHVKPMREIVEVVAPARSAGLESGDIVFACACANLSLELQFCAGSELPGLAALAEREIALTQRLNDRLILELCVMWRQALLNLMGRTPSRTSLDGGGLVEAEWLADLEARGVVLLVSRYHLMKAILLCLHGDYRGALEHAALTEGRLSVNAAMPIGAELPFYTALALAALYGSAPAEDRPGLAARLADAQTQLGLLAKHCPTNREHRYLLVNAEAARVAGRRGEARELYDEAIASARRYGFLQVEAIANELAAKFYLSLGKEAIARVYMTAAHQAFTRWGATAKADDLALAHPTLIGLDVSSLARASDGQPHASAGSSTQLDIGAVLRAAQTLASEIDLARLLERVMRIVVESAGAQRGALLLRRGADLHIAATMSVEPASVTVTLDAPPLDGAALPASIVNTVARSNETVVLGDARRDVRFEADPYIAKHAPRSILCLAMEHQGRSTGVLYLENAAAADAFTPARAGFCGLIAAQAAIAVENASLYRDVQAQVSALQARNREIQQLNDELRRQIAQRSRRLMETLLSNDGPQDEPGNLPIDSILGECYRVVRRIGEGGMGAVYEVERTTDNVRLAAKVLRALPSRNRLVRFAREAQILASLSHPNLLSIVDVDVTNDGVLYLIMELVHGSSLRERSADFRDPSWALSAIAQVADALRVLHSQSIVHRDLKPENILVLSARPGVIPDVKVADFGISIMLDDAPSGAATVPDREGDTETSDVTRTDTGVVTKKPTAATNASLSNLVEFELNAEKSEPRAPRPTLTGAIIGTPFYIAPELVHGSRLAQPASDIFSLGVIAFELLAGAMPFDRPLVLSDSYAHTPAISQRLLQSSRIDARLAALFERCLSLDPEDRPTAVEIADAIALSSGGARRGSLAS